MILHDSEIMLICLFSAQEIFIIINIENSCASYFVYILTIFFRIPWQLDVENNKNKFEK